MAGLPITLECTSNGITTSIQRNTLVANNSQVTVISSRLAAELGIELCQEVDAFDALALFGPSQTKLRFPSKPMVIKHEALPHGYYIIAPLISDLFSFYDIIIAQDCRYQHCLLNALFGPNKVKVAASPGPDYKPVEFMGHNTGVFDPHVVEALVCMATDFVLQFDGASRGNPGPSGGGWVLYRREIPSCSLVSVSQGSLYLGDSKTNNEAEYLALIAALTKCANQTLIAKDCSLVIQGDSEVVVRQLKKEYKVSHPNLIPLNQQAVGLITQLEHVERDICYQHIPREQNMAADALANLAMDEHQQRASENAFNMDVDPVVVPNTVFQGVDSTVNASIRANANANVSTPDPVSTLNYANKCSRCGQPASLSCAKCRSTKYCGRNCQQLSWSSHKKLCVEPSMNVQCTGTTQAELQQMIDEVPPGYVVHLQSGVYTPSLHHNQETGVRSVTPLVIHKPLTLLGAGRKPLGYVSSTDNNLSTKLLFPVKVTCDPALNYATGTVRLSNLQIEGPVVIEDNNYERIHLMNIAVELKPAANAADKDCLEINNCKGKQVLVERSEIYGGSDGVSTLGNDTKLKIVSTDIRFARCRGIFAQNWFTIKDSEVANCGRYGMNTRSGATIEGDCDIQPGPWDHLCIRH